MTLAELAHYPLKHPERISLFEQELNLLHAPALSFFANYCLDHLPEYFFHVPASPSGRYHPSYALGEGGLVRHTKAAIGIAESLIEAGVLDYYNDSNSTFTSGFLTPRSDIVLFALLFHDSYKCGEAENASTTVFEHPRIAASNLLRLWDEVGRPFSEYWMIVIMQCINSHMGRWNSSKRSSVTLPLPNEYKRDTWLAEFVHICDYLASRKFLEYQF